MWYWAADSSQKSVEFTLYLVTEEVEVRVVHVAGWAGWVNRPDIVVEAEREAYVGNVATGSHACRIGGSNYVGGEEKKKWEVQDGGKRGGIRRRTHHKSCQ